MWDDAADAVIDGDLTAGLAYVTPAGGCVVTAVAPLGLRDREQGTVGFTTSLGFGKKLERLRRDPKVALSYHARDHGFARGPGHVLVQGTASFEEHPDRATLEALQPNIVRHLGEPKRGRFWDRWLSAYYADRLLVTVKVERVTGFATDPGLPAAPPRQPPKNGTAPRVPAARTAQRLARLPHRLLAYRGADGFPIVVPVDLGGWGDDGITLRGALPGDGGRRAGLLGHRYQPKLVGLETRTCTGWLDGNQYAPHTESGFKAPANKTLLLLGNGYLARRNLKRARAAAIR